MNTTKKSDLINACLLLIFFVAFTILVSTVNLSPIGPQNTMVGFSGINGLVHKLFPYNETYYKISKYTAIICFIFPVFFSVMGIGQWIRRKSMFKIDRELWGLLILYIALFCTDLLFEKILKINYRPILYLGELEASYPSSHTFFSMGICLSAIIALKKYIINISKRKFVNTIISILMVLIIITRILSGVHWITDIFAGIILALSYVYFYKAFGID